MTPARVVYYLEAAEFGGVERSTLDLLRRLDRSQFEPVVLGMVPPAMADELQRSGVPLVSLPAVQSKFDVRAWSRVMAAVRRSRPAIFHAMLSHSFAVPYALLAARAAGASPVVVTVHMISTASNRRQAQLRRLLNRTVDLQLFPSQWARDSLAAMGQLARRVEIVANNTGDGHMRSRQEARAVLGLPEDAVVVGSVLRLVPPKRPEIVVDLATRVDGVQVVLLGDGPEMSRLRARADGRPVHFAGFRPDAPELVRAFDVFVLPGPGECQPLALLEAMAGGVAVVAADTAGTAEVVEHGRTGLLASSDPESMAAAVRALVADGELRDRLGRAAAQEAARRFAPGTGARRVQELYRAARSET